MSAPPRAVIRMENALGPIAETVEQALAAAGMAGEARTCIDDTRLALVEALNNVVEHGGGAEWTPIVDLKVWRTAESVIFGIEDTGPPFPAALLADAASEAAKGTPEPGWDDGLPELDALPEGGWGLMIIAQCVDRVETWRDGGRNHLLLEKRLATGGFAGG